DAAWRDPRPANRLAVRYIRRACTRAAHASGIEREVEARLRRRRNARLAGLLYIDDVVTAQPLAHARDRDVEDARCRTADGATAIEPVLGAVVLVGRYLYV